MNILCKNTFRVFNGRKFCVKCLNTYSQQNHFKSHHLMTNVSNFSALVSLKCLSKPFQTTRCFSITTQTKQRLQQILRNGVKDKTPKTTPPTTTAPMDEWQQMRQLSLTKKLKFMFVKYWYISIPVHMVTSVLWFGTSYLIAKSGFDVKPILDMIRPYAEKLPLPEFAVHILNSDTNASSAGYVAIALILYKLATPARYATTVGVSFYSIEFFVKRGLIKPVPSGQQIKAQVNQSISRSKLNKVLRERLAKKEELRRRAKKQNTTKK